MAQNAPFENPLSFLSIQAQDFIEDVMAQNEPFENMLFLSIQAQDFIEERRPRPAMGRIGRIPEHSSSGLH